VIGLVTDSNTQLPPLLRDRYGIKVVPLTIVIDGTAYLEGVDLDTTDFLVNMRSGAELSTAAPSPGQFVQACSELAASGVERILSVHVGSELSGTLAAARLGAASSPVPVELVDTGTASFAAGCCVWAAAEALRSGAGIEEAAAAAHRAAARIGNIFIVSSLDRARQGGRLAVGAGSERIPVMALEGNQLQVVSEVSDHRAALAVMSTFLDGWVRPGERLRVGVGDTDNAELADRLLGQMEERSVVVEAVRYSVGPSVAVHTGPGTVGAVWTVI
jgi:DegV family protein with EDD domain